MTIKVSEQYREAYEFLVRRCEEQINEFGNMASIAFQDKKPDSASIEDMGKWRRMRFGYADVDLPVYGQVVNISADGRSAVLYNTKELLDALGEIEFV